MGATVLVLSTGRALGYLLAHTQSVLDANDLIVGSHVRVLAHPVEFGDNEPENWPAVAEPSSLAGHWMFYPEIAQRPTTREASVVWYQTDVATDTFAGVWAAHSFVPSSGGTWKMPFRVAPDSAAPVVQRGLGDYLGLTAVAPFFDIGRGTDRIVPATTWHTRAVPAESSSPGSSYHESELVEI